MEDNTIKVHIIDRENKEHILEGPTDMSMNIMELCKAYDLPVIGECGGMAMCASCHVYVLTTEHFDKRNFDEEAMLDEAYFVEKNSRLGCQMLISPDLDGLKIKIAPETP